MTDNELIDFSTRTLRPGVKIQLWCRNDRFDRTSSLGHTSSTSTTVKTTLR